MLMKNPTSDTLRIESLNLTIKPGAKVEIPDGYCVPRKGANNDSSEPIIAMLAPQLEPADEGLVAAYRANRLTEGLIAEPPAPVRAADLVADGMAPAVAESVASNNAAAAAPRVTASKPQGR